MKKETGKRRKRRWPVLLLILIACSVWIYWGNTAMQTTQITIRSEKIPPAFHGFTMVQVSDLHNTEFGDGQSGLLAAIRDAAPDLIAVTGDLIDSRRTDVEKAMAFIHGAVDLAPVYYVTGNHEARTEAYAQLEQQMAAAGVVILRNASASVTHGGASIRLLGLDDPAFAAQGDGDGAGMIDARLKAMRGESDVYTVLLSHRPELFDLYAANGMDLVLSGHAHGGQIRLPFVGGLVAPNQGLFPSYSAGVYEKNQTSMVVSRGLGNSIFPVRINNRPELIVITLLSSADGGP